MLGLIAISSCSTILDVSRRPSISRLGSFVSAQRSASEISDYDKRVSEFDQKRISARPRAPFRIVSWSDPYSARDVAGEQAHGNGQVKTNFLSFADVQSDEPESESSHARNLRHRLGPRRCKSHNDISTLQGTRILQFDRMRIDVDLCGQLLVMWRRERHLANVAACLEALSSSLARTNANLRADHEAARSDLSAFAERGSVLQQIEATGTRADALTQETQALAYETAQFLVEDLWHMALQPRRRVLTMREKVFGTGRRLPQGVHGAHGRYNRVQWTLDGNERLVDALGRTESEAEEEDELPHESGYETDEVEEEVDAVENLTLKPTWLLRFFNYWGSKWGAITHHDASTKAKAKDQGGSQQKEALPAGVHSPALPSTPEQSTSESQLRARPRPAARAEHL